MATKVYKYSERDITAILDSQSDSDIEEFSPPDTPVILHAANNSRLKSNAEEIMDDSSDTENIFDSVKYSLPKKNELLKESIALKIKLRRSTEQSMYKIDTDSDCERPVRKSRSRVSKQSRSRSSVKIETDASYSDSKKYTEKCKLESDEELPQTPDDNGTPHRSSRNRRPPVRFSHYHCGTLPSLKNESNPSRNSPSLRNRKTINYNEDSLFVQSLTPDHTLRKRLLSQKKNDGSTSDSSTTTVNTKSNNTNLSTRSKRNRKISEMSESNSGTESEVSRTLRSHSRSNSIKINLPVETKVATPKKQDLSKSVIPKKQVLSTSVSNTFSNSVKKLQVGKTVDSTKENNKVNINEKSNLSKVESFAETPKRSKNTSTKRSISIAHTTESIKYNNEVPKSNGEILQEIGSLTDTPKRNNAASKKRNVSIAPNKQNTPKSTRLQVEESNLSTPKSRSLKLSHLTPSMGKRNSALLKPATPLQEARSRLHVSAVPKSLPCREEEFNTIFTFLKTKLTDKSGGCIYISGVPGTGKTATVNEAVRCLQKLINKGQLDDFNYVAINGMKLTEPRQAYVQILKQMTGETVFWEQASRTLEKKFQNSRSKMTLLLVDELDFLCTKRQDVVYNLFDWPTKDSAQLVVVTIANTMDLPERVLMGRVTSRLGLTRLTFQPYNHKQLQQIVTTRLMDFNDFRSEAIQLVARKVSAVSGDARRALDICRRAMEIAESRNAETISLQHVTEAVTEMIASAKIQAIRYCSKMEQIFLQSVAAEVTRTAVEEVYFKDAYRQLEALCCFDGIKVPTITEVLAACERLNASKLIICEHSRADIYQKVLLNISTDDVHYALQDLDLNKT